MKHLVLGASGQIGQYVVKRLVDEKQLVMTWDIAEDKQHDLRDPTNQLLDSAIAQSDFVHFLAFDVGGSTYLKQYQDTFDFVDNNVKIMNNVFGLLKKHNKPFYFASSQMSNMYESTYGRLKAVGESYAQALGGLTVHFWNVYGYENDPEKTHVITDFIDMALTQHRILVKTTGEERRAFMYAEDTALLLYRITHQYDVLVRAQNESVSCEDGFRSVPQLAFASYSDPNVKNPDGSVSHGPIKTISNHLAGTKVLPITSERWTSVKDLAYVVAEIVGEALGIKIEVFVGDKKDTIQDKENVGYGMDQITMEDILGLTSFKYTSLRTGVKKVVEQQMKDYEFPDE